MDSVDLPIVDATSSLPLALETMRNRGRAAVVVSVNGQFQLFKAGRILAGIHQGKRSLSELSPTTTLHEPTLARLAKEQVSLLSPQATQPAYQRILGDADADYAILAAGAQAAIVITASETLAADMQMGPRDCYCGNCEMSNEGSKAGQTCGYCGTLLPRDSCPGPT